jgi:enterochelin esterase family protein
MWEAQLSFPNDAYIEYAISIDKKRKLDSLNKDKVQNGLGEWNNYFSMPAFERTPFLNEGTEAPFFKIKSQTLHDPLRLANGKRRVNFFIPPGSGPFPLLVIFDGQEFLRKGKIVQIYET